MKIDTGKNDLSAIRHGWCCNSEGIPLIWMPLLHWILNGRQGYSPAAALWKQWENFAYALRKTSEYRRLCIQCKLGGEADFKDGRDAFLLLPGIAEYAFGLCKRIVSGTIEALKFCNVFKDNANVSGRTRKFLSQIERVELLVGDSQQFIAAWRTIDKWYWEIADPNCVQSDAEKGIRDLLEHRNVIMQVDLGATDEDWHCDLSIINGNSEILRTYVLEYLEEAVHGLCRLYDEIYDSLGINESIRNKSEVNWVLPYGQVLTIVGRFDDYIAFWPSFGEDNAIATGKSRVQFTR